MPVRIRDASGSDMAAVTAIYAHHVRTGLASFELAAPGIDEMTRRWEAILNQDLPYLVAETDGVPVGYAYASAWRPRPAYRFTVEDTVYVAPGREGRGIGRGLLARLIERCEATGRRQMIAVIGDSANAASIGLHEALGFSPAGILRNVGFKHGRWVDSVLLQRPLGAGAGTLPPDQFPDRVAGDRPE